MVATVIFVVFRAKLLSHVKWPIGATAVLLVFISLGVLAMTFAPQRPENTLTHARLAMSAARRAQANLYAQKEMSLAEATWERTWQALQENNQRWFWRRDFSNVAQLAGQSAQQANFAARRAVEAKDSLATFSVTTMLAVKEKIIAFQNTWEAIPLPRVQSGKLRQGALLLAECEAAYAREDFTQAAARAKAALASVNNAAAQTSKMLKGYFTNLKQWQTWINETIAYSDSANCAVIIVDKLAHVCQVYVDGEFESEYLVELGPRWLGQKIQQGDKTTPEGKYFIIEKMQSPETQYYKALKINYPNPEDSARFEKAKENGALPVDARPGGLIELHGDGGKGTDWTAGCVALQNQDMDEVYAVARLGTPVTIVGSMYGPMKRKFEKSSSTGSAR